MFVPKKNKNNAYATPLDELCVQNHLVPSVVQRTASGERAYDIYSLLLESRIIFLTGPIDDTLASLICAQLLYLDSQDTEKPISLYINSPGGVVTAGLSIYDTMQYITAPVSTYAMGMVASAASLILCVGHKGKRYSLPHTRIMLHQPSGGARGQASDIEIQAREILYLKKVTQDIYINHTCIEADKIVDLLDRDRYLSPIEAKKMGLIDHIVGIPTPDQTNAFSNKIGA